MAIRIGTSTLTFGSVRRLLGRAARVPRLLRSDASAEKISWAVAVASRYTPTTSSCLVQALTVQTLLAGRSQPVHLCFGVAAGADGGVKGHAWVECRERVIIIGGSVAPQYVQLFPPEREGV